MYIIQQRKRCRVTYDNCVLNRIQSINLSLKPHYRLQLCSNRPKIYKLNELVLFPGRILPCK